MKTLVAILITASTFINTLAYAQGDSPVRFSNIAQKQVVTVDAEGKETVELTDVGIMVPGDTVVYTSTFTNIGSEAVNNIVVNNPVPDNTKYMRFTAQGENTAVSFSIDGGNTFAAPADLTVTEANGITRAAKPKEYTDIRWVYQSDLAAGQSGTVNFKVTIL
jgi:uncharacterized repeat protein (TIGR01451 family)